MRFANPQKKPRVLVSLTGHSIEYPGRVDAGATDVAVPEGAEIKAGLVFVHTPPAVAKDAVSAGLVPEDDIPEDEAPAGGTRPGDAEAVKSQVYDAFEKLIAAGDRESFAGTGMPKPEAVSKITGWTIMNAELRDLWTAFQVDSAKD